MLPSWNKAPYHGTNGRALWEVKFLHTQRKTYTVQRQILQVPWPQIELNLLLVGQSAIRRFAPNDMLLAI